MPVSGISVLGRNTTGVKLINLDANKDIKVASIAKVRDTATVADEAAEGEAADTQAEEITAENPTAETTENKSEE